ncbi:hypothetical protein M409DRAFT_28649 [Zasmidium cellare ATCC 36951]|uniref:Shikimate dehydrogenase substrate binding N-terminal domain-containing protein n=1 Tax=Zasmidium cellare ATCC 36951 TaxID=1080233 RepID=A0A6A6C1W1_ZASCE|nr:uncharacterized protein M409DRAFT_28649 [Zasmidium cellare ATCC 36951]KAF2161044.1 hypothetical protein M409DRAFT_28649 [Zasmidium cellare ATCC 36951]
MTTNNEPCEPDLPRLQFYIFGHNIAHSLSPTIHNAAFKELELPYYYSIFETDHVENSVEALIRRSDFGGASVTFLHKLQVAKLLDSLSPSAELIGAVNTIVVEDSADGRRLVGENTDWLGIRQCIKSNAMVEPSSSSAVVLGAGGAARAACFAVQALGVHRVLLVNRTLERARRLASQMTKEGTPIDVFSTLEEACIATEKPISIVVACIPADDFGEDRIPEDLFRQSERGVLVEMAYRPRMTGMITVAGRHPGWKVVRGIDVLAEQAYAQFELWTGKQAPIDVMLRAMKEKVATKI